MNTEQEKLVRLERVVNSSYKRIEKDFDYFDLDMKCSRCGAVANTCLAFNFVDAICFDCWWQEQTRPGVFEG